MGIIIESGGKRMHRDRLNALLKKSAKPVRIASAYVTDRELLLGSQVQDIRLMTSLAPMDIASGATSVETLRAFVEAGIDCRFVPGRPKLHAKVYIFGKNSPLVTSANLTHSALNSNIEVGVEIEGEQVARMIQWFDRLWSAAQSIRIQDLSNLKQQTAKLRRAYVKLEKSLPEARPPSNRKSTGKSQTDNEVIIPSDSKARYFVCNTDRRQGARTATGGFLLEEEMLDRGYATAWEDFKYPGHMEQVEAGDVILMYAKSVGIIAVGRAKGGCEVLQPEVLGRVDKGQFKDSVEWRVPVRWIEWRDHENAYSWKAGNMTFWDVSSDGYSDLREKVRNHFLNT